MSTDFHLQEYYGVERITRNQQIQFVQIKKNNGSLIVMHAATKQISCTTAAVKTDSTHSALPSKWKFPSKTPKVNRKQRQRLWLTDKTG
jgi:hypothetical protein